MFNLEDYTKLDYINDNNLFSISVKINQEQIDKDLKELENILTSLAGAVNKQLIFIVDKDKVRLVEEKSFKEVVHCKDCKYYGNYQCCPVMTDTSMYFPSKDFFCKKGRKGKI